MGDSTQLAPEAPPFARQHSRSSSQLATLGSLAGTASYPSSPSKQRNGTQSPRYSMDGLRGYESPHRVAPPLEEDSDNYSSPELDRQAPFQLGSPARRIQNLPFTTSPTLSATHDPASDTQNSTPELSTSSPRSDSPSLANLIQQRRRQASAPYFASARSSSLFSPGAGFGIPSTSAVPYGESTTDANGNSSWAGAWGNSNAFSGAAADEEERRARSRRQSRAGTVSGLSLKPTTSFGNNGFGSSAIGQRSVSEDYDGMRNQGMVMTPTTEEWRQLGGRLSELADIRARDEARLLAASTTVELPTSPTKPVPERLSSSSTIYSDISTSSSNSSIDVATLARNTLSNTGGSRSNINSTPAKKLLPSHLDAPLTITPTKHNPLQPSATSPPPLIPQTFSIPSSFSFQTSRTGFTSHSHSTSLSYDPESLSLDVPSPAPSITSTQSASPNYTEPLPSTSTFVPTHSRLQQSDSSFPALINQHLIRPNLSRGSLSTSTGKPGSPSQPPPDTLSGSFLSYPLLNRNLSTASSIDTSPAPTPPPLELPLLPIELDERRYGRGKGKQTTVDPRRYSAYNGLRSIEDFVVEGEAGKGAYGTVRRARERGADGLPKGPELIIKYVIKQRILADCWKKHKILGPIPIEVHVLDHLRRVPYEVRPTKGSEEFERRLLQRKNSSGRVVVALEDEPLATGHPNICGLLDFFEDGEFYYLVMPRAGVSSSSSSTSSTAGQDLFDYVDLHPNGLSLSAILRIFSQVADAIYFLHQHGIVHRDIKDENIVLDGEGNVMLIDFGSAAYVREGKKFDTFSGTLDFAAPEVLRGERYGGKETDIWALGVLGYVIICGECPFWSPEDAIQGLFVNTRAEIALRAKCTASTPSSISSSPASPPTLVTPTALGLGIEQVALGTMNDMVDIVMRCLEIDPRNRPTSDQVLDHAFLLGNNEGWSGFRGWE